MRCRKNGAAAFSACAIGLVTSLPVYADGAPAGSRTEEVVVIGRSISTDQNLPTTTESVTADVIAKTINVVTPEDTVKYLPNVLIRQRHIGDTQSPVTTRTSGVGASARSLIYVDGVLISSLIGNNNTSASPKWGLVSPDAIERVDVLYGPFAAAYAGNSIGSVIAFTTQMPTAFEASAQVQGALQSFDKYGDDKTYRTGRFAANVGDRLGDIAVRLSYNHLDNKGQPLGYATATVPAGTSASGTVVTGAFADANRTNVPISVLGSTGIENQIQDNVSGRLTYDITPSITAGYTFGLFTNNNDSTVKSYLRDGGSQTLYAGALNINGRAYNLAASTFSNSVYRFDEVQLAQGLSVASHAGGAFDFEIVGTLFDYIKSRQRIPSTALPGAFTGGAGSVASLDDTGWYTGDAKGIWRPFGDEHVVTFGVHQDRFKLNNPRYALTDWINGADGSTQSSSAGRTRTQALWLQEAWAATPQITATIGGRYERWQAYNGVNYSASPALNVAQPAVKNDALSPKFVLAYAPTPDWTVKGSVGLAYRFPTVTELYQAITTGTVLSVPNPNLKPERALSSELSVQKTWTGGNIRVSVFDERLHNTLLSQTASLNGSTQLFSYVQNIDRTHATGLELVASQKNVVIPGLDLSGWVTYVTAKIDKDTAFAAAVGKNLPQLPHWRGSMVVSYSPIDDLSMTLAARYSDRAFATIDNSDHYDNTYQGFGAYLVVDTRIKYQLTPQVAASFGINNINNRAYFLFHPFPQRTFVADLKYTY